MGVKEAVEIEQPARVKIRRIKLDIMDEQMSKSRKLESNMLQNMPESVIIGNTLSDKVSN